MKLLPLLLFALAACDRDSPPAPSDAQADQLNEAEDMLNEMAENEAKARHPRESGDPASI